MPRWQVVILVALAALVLYASRDAWAGTGEIPGHDPETPAPPRATTRTASKQARPPRAEKTRRGRPRQQDTEPPLPTSIVPEPVSEPVAA